MELLQLLESRIKEAGLKITFNPPGDGLCFYRAAGYQLGLSGEALRDRVFEFLKENRYNKDGNDRMNFISDVDIGHVEKPSSWSDALAVLKENYATSMVVRAFADCFQRIVYVVTANGETNYIKVFEPQFKNTAEYIYLGHTGIHYMALAPLDKIQQGKKEVVEVRKEELLPYAEACETRGKRINFIDPSISSDTDTPSISSTSSTSTKHQVIPDKTVSPISCKKKKNLPTTTSEAGDSSSNSISDVVERYQEHFNRIYPSLDKSRTVMCLPIFQYDYKAPTEEKAAGYSKSMKKIEHTIKGDEAEQSVFRALADSGEPMFVIRDLKLSPFLQSIVQREITKKEYRQLDFVIIHWNIGVLLVEVKHKDSKSYYRDATDELENGERIIKDVIAALQSQQHIDSYDKDQNHVDEHLTDPTNVTGKTTVCQTQDDVHAVKVQTQSNASRDVTATIEAVGEAHTQADASVKEMKDVNEPVGTQIPVYKVYAAPNDELKNTGSPYIRLGSTSLKNIPDWLKSNFPNRTFNDDNQGLLHNLCSVFLGQKTEITTAGSQIQFSDQVLTHKLQQQIHGAIDSQSFLKQSYEKDFSKKKKNQTVQQERNVVSTRDRDQPHLSILAEQFLFLNKEQLAVWEGPLHQIIDGTSGSGKTILLMYKALACARKGEKVRVYCPQKLLPLYEKFFQDHSIDEDIATFESFGDIWGTHGFCSNEQTCHIFIDEFQLSVNNNSERNLELLREKLPKKALMYYWIAFSKVQPLEPVLTRNNFWESNQIQKLLTWLPELQRLGFHRTMLNTCVRNTRNIQDFVQWCMEYEGVTSTLPEEIQSVHPGHNIHGDRVNVYFVEKKDGDVRGESDRISKDDLPPSAVFSGTIPRSKLGGKPYDGIAETIKKEIESYSSSQRCAVFFTPWRYWAKMLEAMTNQDIPVSFDPLSDSNTVYVSQGMDVHSYEWDTVVVICEHSLRQSFFLYNYLLFTRAISKLVVIFYTTLKKVIRIER